MADVIVLTTDFSEEAARAYGPTLDLAKRLGARVEFVHVVPDLVAIPYGSLLAPPQHEPDLAAKVKAAKEELDKITSSLGTDVDVSGAVLTGEYPERVLAAHAQELGAKWIAMASHGRSGLRRIVLGSFAEAVLRHSTTPIAIYPPPD